MIKILWWLIFFKNVFIRQKLLLYNLFSEQCQIWSGHICDKRVVSQKPNLSFFLILTLFSTVSKLVVDAVILIHAIKR